MPERPYLPLGTLRAAVCYPAEPGRFDEAELAQLGGRTLIPGMPAEVLINKSARTPMSYLLAPLAHGIWTAFRE